MSLSPSAPSRLAPDPAPRRLAVRLYLYSALGELIPLYPVYALLFDRAGLTTAQISSLFAIWSLTAILVEVPSGVWADTFSRRALLVLAPLLSGAGFGLWVVAPSYPVFALGFVLWGTQSALRSGALEALVYEELDRHGRADRYPRLLGRAAAAGTTAAVTAIALATPLLAMGGVAAAGAASVLSCLLCSAVAVGFPESRRPSAGDARRRAAVGAALRGYLATLRDGIGEVRSRARVRAAVLVVPAVSSVWGALDEYTPLLAAESGTSFEQVPLAMLIVYAGVVTGGLLGAPVSSLGARGSAVVLAAAAVVLALAAVATGGDHRSVGFVGLALAFAGFQAATIAADTRLQDAVTGAARSTVTSLAGLGTEVVTVAVYALYAAGSSVAAHRALFVVLALAYLPVAVLLPGAMRRPAVEPT